MNLRLVIATSAFVVTSCTAFSKASQGGPGAGLTFSTVEYKELAGVDSNLLSLDVYAKGEGDEERPVVIWVHGGAWCLGDKTNSIERKRDLFLEQDWVLVSVNYRLSPGPLQFRERRSPDRVKYPDHNNDVADAVAWVYRNIEAYGGDKSRIALVGHSAGAHLVSLTGTKPDLLESRGVPFSALQGVATIDTDAYDVRADVEEGISMMLNAFGTDAALNDDASPLFHAKRAKALKLELPDFFMGKRGTKRRTRKMEAFAGELKAAEARVVEFDGDQYSHSGINKSIGKEGDQGITPALIQFLKSVF